MKKAQKIFDYALIAAMAILIIVVAVVREQTFIKTLPTLITLIVQLMVVRVNRFAYLLGGVNALLYGISYYSEGLYFSLISTCLMSALLQFCSFASWSKKAKTGAPLLRFLGFKKIVLVIGVLLVGWGICVFGLSHLFTSSTYPVLDTYLFVAGVISALLVAWRYVEAQYLNIVSMVVSVVLWGLLTVRNPANFNYVLINMYNLYRVIQGAVSWTKKCCEMKVEN